MHILCHMTYAEDTFCTICLIKMYKYVSYYARNDFYPICFEHTFSLVQSSRAV